MSALKIELPPGERGVGEFEQKTLDRINRRLARADLTLAQRDAALRAREMLERAPKDQAEREAVDAGIVESALLAEKRGEEVETSKTGVVRVIDRDPLLSLLRAQHITPEQFDIADKFRGLYESRAADARVANYGGTAGGGYDNDRDVKAGLRRAKANQLINAAETAILNNLQMVHLMVWSGVVGGGKALSSFGKGSRFERNAKALSEAIDVAEGVL